MLDDIFDLFSDLVGETNVHRLTGQKSPVRTPDRKPSKPRTSASRTTPTTPVGQNKLTASRDRRGGEDPWDWKEKKPPWEF